MRLWVFSDLHLEADDWQWPMPPPEADVCVVAGDVGRVLSETLRFLDMTVGKRMPVVFVAGNHEFYGGATVLEGIDAAREQAGRMQNVRFLENETAVVDGVRFLGCTLWTDYAVDGDEELAMAMASMQVLDHRKIWSRALPVREQWTPAHALALHRRSRKWLETELPRPFDGPTVVVTHHAPHPRSIAERFKASPVNGAFVSDLTSLLENGPTLWVHGHTHDSFDYRVGRTRVVCNPKGYETENPRFDPSLVVEV